MQKMNYNSFMLRDHKMTRSQLAAQVYKSRYITSFAVSGSTKKIFLIDCLLILLSSVNSFCQQLSFLNIFFQYISKVWGYSTLLIP